MYSVTLGVAAYALFGSSLISLFYLFRENSKKCVTSPLHIFTISDALSSIFAGIIFLVNQLNMDTSVNPESKGVNNVTKFNRDILHFLNYAEENGKTNEFENPVDCGFKNVIMHYGMFFIPFTNAFVSLLGYSFHYIINITRLDGSCMESMKSMKQIMEEKRIEDEESMKDVLSPGPSSKRYRHSSLESIVSRNEVKTSAPHALKDINFNQSNDKMTLVNVVLQWLLPMLITIILHFGDYPKLSEERTILKDDECIFMTNFPFNHCYPQRKQNESFSLGIFSNSTVHPEAGYNYIEATDSVLGSNLYSQEIDNVVSSVYKLVHASLSANESNNSSAFSTSDLWNITRFVEKNLTYPENGLADEWKLFEDLDQTANETSLEFGTKDAEINLKPVKILESETILELDTLYKKSNFETTTVNILKEKNKTNYNSDNVNNESVNIVSRNDIYEDLIKKIKNGIQKIKVKEKIRLNRNIEIDTNFTLPNESQCLKNQCFISTNFLKIHLFILLFIVYFIPILASTIINVCVSYKFKQIKDKIETNCITLNILTNFGNKKVEMKNKGYEDETKDKNVSWFPEGQEKSQKIEEIGVERISPMKIEIIKDDEILRNILKKLGTAERFTKILKINLLLAILLWTPLFMEVLSKVFLCMNIPNWLMDSSFLGAISFGIVRNVLNINMIKMVKTDEGTKKDNSIHPSL